MSTLTTRYCEQEADRVLAGVFAELPDGASNATLIRQLQQAYPFGEDKSRTPYEAWLARCRAWTDARAAGRPRPMDKETTRRLRKADASISTQQDLF